MTGPTGAKAERPRLAGHALHVGELGRVDDRVAAGVVEALPSRTGIAFLPAVINARCWSKKTEEHCRNEQKEIHFCTLTRLVAQLQQAHGLGLAGHGHLRRGHHRVVRLDQRLVDGAFKLVPEER